MCWNLSLQELESEFEQEGDEEVIQSFRVWFYSLSKRALHPFSVPSYLFYLLHLAVRLHMQTGHMQIGDVENYCFTVSIVLTIPCNVFRDLMRRKPKMTMKMRGMKRRPEPSSIPTGSDNLCLQNAWDWASKGLMKPRRPLLRCFSACLSWRFRSYFHNFSLSVEKQLFALLYKISVLGLQIICCA